MNHPARTRSFTRRGGRMPERHERALAVHGERFILAASPEQSTMVDPEYVFDPIAEFGRAGRLIIEVGSGSGDCVVAAAAAAPEVNFLACEVWRPGVAQTIAKAAAAGVDNIRILVADAAEALPSMIEPSSVDEVWTFFPDPWPKSKHHKRRLVAAPFASAVANMLVPQGYWRLATDWADYAWQIRDVLESTPGLVNAYPGRLADPGDHEVDPEGSRGGFAPRFAGRALTRFERKGDLAQRIVRDVVAQKVTEK